MKNTFQDLNNALFAQLERVTDEELTDEDLKKELARSKAVTDISKNIIEAGKTVVAARKVALDEGAPIGEDPLSYLSKSKTPTIEHKQ